MQADEKHPNTIFTSFKHELSRETDEQLNINDKNDSFNYFSFNVNEHVIPNTKKSRIRFYKW